jgi:hypothetical protein
VDKHVVEILERKGIEAWISRTKSKRGKRGRTSIKPGKQWMDEITKGLQNANRVLVIVSKNSAKSDWVKREVRVAMTLPHLRDRIIPVCIDETPPKDVELFLSPAQAIDYKDVAELDQDFEPMVDASHAPIR